MDPSPHPELKIDQMPQTLREIVLARLRRAIISGRFASGERLVERTLCDQLGVSRSVVKQCCSSATSSGTSQGVATRKQRAI